MKWLNVYHHPGLPRTSSDNNDGCFVPYQYLKFDSQLMYYRLDMQKECSRLLDGFSAAVGTSEAKKTLSEIQELVKPPKWQKSTFWQVLKVKLPVSKRGP